MLINLPSIPDLASVNYRRIYQQVLPAPANFTSATNTQSFTLFGMPANWMVGAIKITPFIQFSGPNLTSVTAQVGTIASSNCYATPFELTQVISPATFQITMAESGSTIAEQTLNAHDVIVTFISTGGAINTISAGSVEILVSIKPF